jgi:hypothetical protein
MGLPQMAHLVFGDLSSDTGLASLMNGANLDATGGRGGRAATKRHTLIPIMGLSNFAHKPTRKTVHF